MFTTITLTTIFIVTVVLVDQIERATTLRRLALIGVIAIVVALAIEFVALDVFGIGIGIPSILSQLIA